MRKNTKKNKNVPAFVIGCPKCGEKYEYADPDEFSKIDESMPCSKCGFLLYDNLIRKMSASIDLLLNNDPKSLELIEKGDYDGFSKYLQKKTGCL